jgi:hypothetical protein
MKALFIKIKPAALLTAMWNIKDQSPYIIIQRQKENHALLGYYAASVGNFLPTIQDNLLVLSSRVQNLFAVSTLEDLFWNTVNFLGI